MQCVGVQLFGLADSPCTSLSELTDFCSLIYYIYAKYTTHYAASTGVCMDSRVLSGGLGANCLLSGQHVESVLGCVPLLFS